MANNTQVAVQQVSVSSITQMPAVAKRFSDILGKKSPGFISSLVSLSKTKALAVADPNTVVASALIAASLDLPIVPTLGFAAIVPFYDSKTKQTLAQFQIMTKGLIQLAQRSGQYKTINVAAVYEGDIKGYNRFTGEIDFDPCFEKYLYMTTAELEAHGKRYSQTFKKGFGLWKDNFEAMAKKTVLKLLLSKYGPLSVDTQMQLAIQADQAAIRMESIEDTAIADATMEYVDGVEDVTDAPDTETPEQKKERMRNEKKENPEMP